MNKITDKKKATLVWQLFRYLNSKKYKTEYVFFFLNKCSFLQNSVFSINCWAGKVNSTIQNKIEGIDFSFFFSIKGQEMLLPKPYPLSHIAFRVFPFSRQEKFISDIIGKRKQINCCHRLNYSEILSFIHA